jgi:hypothetical protein
MMVVTRNFNECLVMFVFVLNIRYMVKRNFLTDFPFTLDGASV